VSPAIEQALASLIGAIATAVLLYASFNWGPNRKKGDDDDDE
jgi:hypothetical protein